jgi:DNA ligase 1
LESSASLSEWIGRLRSLPELGAEEQRARVLEWWRALPRRELFLLVKMITGELRVGVADTLVIRAVAEVARVPAGTIAHRLMGTWEPSGAFFAALTNLAIPSKCSSKTWMGSTARTGPKRSRVF